MRFLCLTMGSGINDSSRVNAVKKYMISDRFTPQINHQICDAIITDIKYQLSVVDIVCNTEDVVKQSLTNTYEGIIFENLKVNREKSFRESLELNDYTRVLKIFNYKSLSESVGHFFNIEDREYCDFVIR